VLEHELAHTEPKVGPWICLGMLIITIGLMAATAEFVSARAQPISPARTQPNVSQRTTARTDATHS